MTPDQLAIAFLLDKFGHFAVSSIMSDPATPMEVITVALLHPNRYVRSSALFRATARITPELWAQLAASDELSVRANVALHCTLPDILTRLAQDQEPYVRANVAENEAVPRALLEQLATDPDEGVTRAACQALADLANVALSG